MIDYQADLVSALEMVLPTHYELALTKDTETPCISYMENDNYDVAVGDTLGYSRLSYIVKIWGNHPGVIAKYAKEVDAVMRGLGFKRTVSNELHDRQSTMIQKIITYEALGFETY